MLIFFIKPYSQVSGLFTAYGQSNRTQSSEISDRASDVSNVAAFEDAHSQSQTDIQDVKIPDAGINQLPQTNSKIGMHVFKILTTNSSMH
jgi:hypothetical protein